MKNILWTPSKLATLFDVDWNSTQLKKAAVNLGLGTFEVSISGGAVVRTLMGTDIFKGDIDIFPHTFDALERLTKHFAEYDIKESKHAMSFDYVDGVRKTKVQIITKYNPVLGIEQTLNSFDLEHCKFAYYPKGDILVTSNASPICLAQRQIRLANVTSPHYTMGRVIKYKRLGFEADKAIELLTGMIIRREDGEDFSDFTAVDLELTLSKGSS